MAHVHTEPGQYDLVTACFPVHVETATVLLIKHKKLGGWFAPGGHVELDEDTDQALFREMREETGLEHTVDYRVLQDTASVLGLRGRAWDSVRPENSHNTRLLLTPWRVDRHDFPPLPGHRHLALVYLAHAFRRDVRLEAEAHDDIRWFDRADLVLTEGMVPSIKAHALDAIDAVCGWKPGH